MFAIDKKQFGAFVAELRKEKGFTQKSLAERLFISDKAISKWETGASIPDTALLIPLAELLGVSVTELLLCQRMPHAEAMDSSQVEDIVKTAISYSEEIPSRAYKTRGKWAVLYGLSLMLGGIGLFLGCRHGEPSPMAMTAFALGLVFGAYFCFFARQKLPAYYDEHRINTITDGIFQMHVPGLYFNNTNWPHIVLVGRIWAWLAMGIYPWISVLMVALLPEAWLLELFVCLTLLLGGLFVPVYIVGKRVQ